MAEIRLNKFLAEAGVASRRSADSLIESGAILVNGKPITALGTKVDPEKDVIEYNGQIVKPADKVVYYALYKPRGVVSTASDELGRQKVTDLVPSSPRVYPIGRLDADSEGLIILTNDGELTQQMTHPSFQHEKEYKVYVKNQNLNLKSRSDIEKLISDKFTAGMNIEGNLMKADKIFDIESSGFNISDLSFKLILHTGFNRQIRRMCAKIGLEVIRLIRIRVGKLKLDNLCLTPGKYVEVEKSAIL